MFKTLGARRVGFAHQANLNYLCSVLAHNMPVKAVDTILLVYLRGQWKALPDQLFQKRKKWPYPVKE